MVASGNRGFVMCYGFGLEHAANLDHTVSCHYRQGVRQELVARAFLRDGTAIVDVTLDLKVTIVDVILKNEVPTVASSVRQLTLRLKLSLLHAWHVSFMAAYRGSLLIEIGSLCDLPMSKSSSDVFGKAVELSGLRQSEREPDDKSCDGPDEDRWPEERPKSPAAAHALRYESYRWQPANAAGSCREPVPAHAGKPPLSDHARPSISSGPRFPQRYEAGCWLVGLALDCHRNGCPWSSHAWSLYTLSLSADAVAQQLRLALG
eukprot:CAMPEP_0115314912 /NCGR_PEP_ID=MMETSP0270-20121206/77296_2 /TAXON_ID=71861 /ORGANISM="Scrippsiella trochoidea, Strain CCMP3099" /LENGTH=261 /DNA_ID=CAMNT_0002734191 /DNA_START=201 /DNA_END=988 /DNA_ORIENTATION=-